MQRVHVSEAMGEGSSMPQVYARASRVVVLLGLSLTFVSCSTFQGDSGGDDDLQEVGPVAVDIPESWENVTDEYAEGPNIEAFVENTEATEDRHLLVNTEIENAVDVPEALNVLWVEYAGQYNFSAQEQFEMPGADEARTRDVEAGEIVGRWWVAGDQESDTLVFVEYAGADVDQQELDEFGESLELRP